MKSFDREQLLCAPVRRFLRARGFVHVAVELQFYEYHIDLYGYSPANALSVAVELKLTRWRRALEQAIRYQLCADLVFIAVPDYVAPRIDEALLADYGIGLLSVSPRPRACRERMAAFPSASLLPDYKDTYRRVLTGTS